MFFFLQALLQVLPKFRCIVFYAQPENMHSVDSPFQLDKKMADRALFKMKNGFPHEK